METKINTKIFVFALLVITPVFHLTTVPDIALLPRFICWSVTLLFSTFLFIKTKPQTSYLIVPDIAFLLYYFFTILSLLWALNTANAVFEIQKVFAVLVTYLFLRVLLLRTEGKIIPFILWCNLILTILILAVVFLQTVTYEDGIDKLIAREFKKIRGFSASRNLLCSFLYLTLVFNVFAVIYHKNKKRRWGYLLPISIQIFVMLLLQARATYMALFVSGVCFLIGFQYITRYFNLKRAIIFLGIFILITGGILTRLMLADDDFKIYLEKINITQYIQSKTGKERIMMWKRTVQLTRERVWTGVGAGNWAIFYPDETTKVRVEYGKFAFFQRPHNDFVWTFSEIGILGGLAYLALFAFLLIPAFLSIIKKENPDERLKILVVFTGLVGYIVIANFSFPKERIEHQIWLTLILSMLTYYLRDYFKHKTTLLSKIHNGVWIGMLLVGLCFNLIIGYYRYQGEKVMKLVYANSLLLQDKTQLLDKAQSYFYQSDHIGFPLAWHQGMTANAMSQPEEALKYFITAYQLHPNNFRILNDLAAAYDVAGNYEEAIRHFETAHKLYPEGEATIYNLAILYYRIKDYPTAMKWTEKLSEDYPRKDELMKELSGKQYNFESQ